MGTVKCGVVSVQKRWTSFSLSMPLVGEKLLILGVHVGQRNGAKGCKMALHFQMDLQVSHPRLWWGCMAVRTQSHRGLKKSFGESAFLWESL